MRMSPVDRFPRLPCPKLDSLPYVILLTPLSSPQLKAVENDPGLKLVDQDPDGLYISATAKSAVPPDGLDKLEFLFK